MLLRRWMKPHREVILDLWATLKSHLPISDHSFKQVILKQNVSPFVACESEHVCVCVHVHVCAQHACVCVCVWRGGGGGGGGG